MTKTIVVLAAVGTATAALAQDVYYVDSGTPPWGMPDYALAMDNVFGAGNWTGATYGIDPNTLLSDSTSFIYLEGSDSSANELSAFLGANLGALENWVAGGGTLYMNAAPNEGGNINFGFGTTGVLLTYPSFSAEGHAVDPNHPVFDGIATSYTGNSFGHATLSGGDISPIIENESGLTVLAEKGWGDGGVVFGGMTAPFWQDPQPDSQILLENILGYTTGLPAPGAAVLLGLGGLVAARRRR